MIPLTKNIRQLVKDLGETFAAIDESNGLEQQIEQSKRTLADLQAKCVTAVAEASALAEKVEALTQASAAKADALVATATDAAATIRADAHADAALLLADAHAKEKKIKAEQEAAERAREAAARKLGDAEDMTKAEAAKLAEIKAAIAKITG